MKAKLAGTYDNADEIIIAMAEVADRLVNHAMQATSASTVAVRVKQISVAYRPVGGAKCNRDMRSEDSYRGIVSGKAELSLVIHEDRWVGDATKI